MEAVYLGILSSSVRTEALLTDDEGRRLGVASQAHGDSWSSRELLQRVLEQVLQGYPEHRPPLVAVVAMPGLGSPGLRRSALELLRGVFPTGMSAALCDELEAALAGGLGCRPGLIVRSGSEATVGRVDVFGCFTRTEAPVDPLGQEGSGLWLGTRTLQMAARMLEGRLPHSHRLEAALRRHFSSGSLGEVLHRIEEHAPPAESVAALGSVIVELGGFPEPDPACRALVMRAARQLAALVREAAGAAPQSTITWAGPTLGGALLEELRKDLCTATWIEPQHSELEGCLLLARARAAQPPEPEGERIGSGGRGLWLAAQKLQSG